MRKTLLVLFTGISSLTFAQDSTSVKAPKEVTSRKCTHEIGFNGTLLVKQLISDNPSATLAQLPYVVNYQVGFGGKIGLRLGLGFEQNTIKTSVQGQISPRTTTVLTGSYRFDICRQVFSYKKFGCGMYFGGIMDHSKLETSTTTQSSFGTVTTSELTNNAVGYGAELGISVKYSFNERFGLGAEMPLQCKYTTSKETDFQSSSSGTSITTITDGRATNTKIFLPTSIYICVNF